MKIKMNKISQQLTIKFFFKKKNHTHLVFSFFVKQKFANVATTTIKNTKISFN